MLPAGLFCVEVGYRTSISGGLYGDEIAGISETVWQSELTYPLRIGKMRDSRSVHSLPGTVGPVTLPKDWCCPPAKAEESCD
jgi:hypothetical protein